MALNPLLSLKTGVSIKQVGCHIEKLRNVPIGCFPGGFIVLETMYS